MKKLLLFASFMSLPFFGYGQTVLSEDFQTGSLPTTWTVQQTNAIETWHVEDPNLGTDYKATVNYDETLGAQNEMLISPSMDFTMYSGYTLKANIGLSYYWAVNPNNNYDAFIKVSIDNGATWTQVWSENDLGTFTNWTMNPVSVNLTPYVGNSNVKIAFQYVGTDGAALYVDNVSVTVPPTTAPDCPALVSPADTSTGVNYMSAVALSWTAPTSGSTVDSYEVYFGTTPNPTALLTTVTTTTASVPTTSLAASTTYYWRVVSKNAAGSSTSCSEWSFTTKANPFAPYCGPLTFTYVEPITLVDFAGINNTTSASTTGGTAHEDFISLTGAITAGSTYTITLKGNTGGNYTNYFAVFIDWNQDGDFADTGETYSPGTIVNSTGTDATQLTYDITVPSDATVGTTRMRVKKQYGTTSPLTEPCLGATFGQTEEYSLTLSPLAAVANVNKAQAKVFPNPVVDVMNVEASSKVKSVSVYDLSGKSVSTHELNAVKSQVNLSKLTPGVYMVKIETENGTQTVKIVKK